MSIIYYPKNSVILRRDTLSASYEQLELNLEPNAIFYFGPTLSALSNSMLQVTSSWSNSSSYSITSSYSLNGGSTGTSLTTGSTYPITSSWSSVNISSSHAIYADSAGSAPAPTSVDITGTARFRGSVTEATSLSGVHLGIVATTPRIVFADGTSTRNWEIDQSSDVFRWYKPGFVYLALTTGSLSIGGQSTSSPLLVNGGASIGAGYFYTIAPSNGLLVQGKVGIGTTIVTNSLDVVGNVSANIITASLFFGTSSWSVSASWAPGGNSGPVVSSSWASSSLSSSVLSGINYKTIWIPAGSLIPNLSSGSSAGTYELPADRVVVYTQNFDKSYPQSAQFSLNMPKSWDLGTIQCKFIWTTALTGSLTGSLMTGSVVWTICGGSVSNNETLNFTFGNTQSIVATTLIGSAYTSSCYHYTTSYTDPITIGGSPQSEDSVWFKVSRYTTSSLDTLSGSAGLLGLKLLIGTTTSNDL